MFSGHSQVLIILNPSPTNLYNVRWPVLSGRTQALIIWSSSP